MVFVLSMDGTPLMPCENVIARLLLKQGKAQVRRRQPFVIKLLEPSTSYTQECTLGIDTGSSVIGSAVVANGKAVYLSEVTVRNDIKDKMDTRRTYRRNRRYRKTRYRKPRFLNRGSSTRKERFSPTMVSKLHSHEKEIAFVKSILPITQLVLETGTFDMHLMKNPALANPSYRVWGYQKGENYGYTNAQAKTFTRDKYTCQHCKTKKKGVKLEAHHIVYRRNGGSDCADNLTTLCHNCHSGLHKGMWKLNFKGERKGNLSHATQMNCIRIQLLKNHPEAIETFGYITKHNRQLLGLEKTHCSDAAVIAVGGNSVFFSTNVVLVKRCVSDGDFQKTKGVRSEQRIETNKICGFRKYDKVRYFGEEYFVKGRMSTGYAILMDIGGTKVDFTHMPRGFKTPKLALCKRIGARKSWIMTEIATRSIA